MYFKMCFQGRRHNTKDRAQKGHTAVWTNPLIYSFLHPTQTQHTPTHIREKLLWTLCQAVWMQLGATGSQSSSRGEMRSSFSTVHRLFGLWCVGLGGMCVSVILGLAIKLSLLLSLLKASIQSTYTIEWQGQCFLCRRWWTPSPFGRILEPLSDLFLVLSSI